MTFVKYRNHFSIMVREGKKNILSSWKDISNYLGIAVRTAQRWEEEFNLPVKRIEKFKKTYVFAFVDDINKWLKKRPTEKPSKKSIFKKLKILFGIIIFITALSAILIFFLPINLNYRGSILSDYKVKGTQLLTYNIYGKELWKYSFNVELKPESYLPEHAHISNYKKYVWFKDIDNDEHTEVIFASKTKDLSNEKIFCFDEKGKLLWSFFPGKAIKYGDHPVSQDFDIRFVRLIDLDNDGILEIVVVAVHKFFFPSRVVILNQKGEMKGEYWNSGHISCVKFEDLNNDGLKEIILGGVNNNYRKACLIVLDLRKISGSSPQIKGSGYYSEELETGTEKYYVLIPENEVAKALFIQDYIDIINLFKNKIIQISTCRSKIIFEFDYNLNPVYLYLGDEFMFKYNELKKEGKITKPLDYINKKELISKILYWNGSGWTNKPVRTSFWNNKS